MDALHRPRHLTLCLCDKSSHQRLHLRHQLRLLPRSGAGELGLQRRRSLCLLPQPILSVRLGRARL